MRLSQFLQQICALTPLQIAIPEEQDAWLENPIALLNIRMYSRISDVITNACKAVGLSERGARVFGVFIAELCTAKIEVVPLISDEVSMSAFVRDIQDIIKLYKAFGRATYNDEDCTTHLCLWSDWDAIGKRIGDIQRGVIAAFEEAKLL
jgi:uncharacterized protein YqgV (UPF0045/DUF77 family)